MYLLKKLKGGFFANFLTHVPPIKIPLVFLPVVLSQHHKSSFQLTVVDAGENVALFIEGILN